MLYFTALFLGVLFVIVCTADEAKETPADDQPRDDGAPPSHKESETAAAGEPPATRASAGSMTKADEAQSADEPKETAAVAGDAGTDAEVGKAEAEAEQEQVVVEMEENKV